MSGRAIYTLAIATNPRLTLNNWDRSVVHFPFCRGARVAGGPIRVPPDADAATLEAARQGLKHRSMRSRRGLEIVDGERGGGDRG
jgi:lysophospholipid acyltransferase (LPLAT)-like uncharacterized protein